MLVMPIQVEEAELKRAKIYARKPGNVCATSPLPFVSDTRQRQQEQRKQQQQPQATSCSSSSSSCRNSNSRCDGKTGTHYSSSASPTGESTDQTKRPRPCPSAREDVVSATKALIETGSSRTDGCPLNDKRRIYSPGHPAYNSIGGRRSSTVRVVGAVSSCVNGDSGSDGNSSNGGCWVRSVGGSKEKEAGAPLSKMRKVRGWGCRVLGRCAEICVHVS